MDLRGAESNIQKLLNYIQQLQGSSSGMYSKSKNRLRDISAMCIQTANIISDILKDEILSDVSMQDYQSENSMSDLSLVTRDVRDQLSSIADDIDTFVSPSFDVLLSDVITKSSAAPVLTSDEVKTITRKNKIDTLSRYREVFKNTSEVVTEYPIVNRITKLLHLWFESRFYKSMQSEYKLNYSFHYLVSDIRIWVIGFVLYFGNILYSSADSSSAFADVEMTFNYWIHAIQTSTKYPYATPYPIYSICHSFNSSIVTTTSLVLWDMLQDAGYSKLCVPNNRLFPQKSDIYDICVLYDLTDVLDSYCDYQYDPSILKTCKLT